jgi:hypothetical protein
MAQGGETPFEVLNDAYRMETVINGYLKLDEEKLVQTELLDGIDVTLLSPKTLQALHNAGCISHQIEKIINETTYQRLYFYTHMINFALAVTNKDIVKAKAEWQLGEDIKYTDDKALSALSEGLIMSATMGYMSLTKALIEESSNKEFFFPIERALLFLETKDQSLVEKLSPEVRPLIEDLILQIQRQTEKRIQASIKKAQSHTNIMG